MLALLLPELLADALLDALALLAASPLLPEALWVAVELDALLAAADLVVPLFLFAPWPVSHEEEALWLAALAASVEPFDDVLADVELLAALEFLAWLAELVSVAFELAALLLVLALFAAALLVDAADFTSLACCALLAVEAFDVVSEVLALLEAEDIFVDAAYLLALAFSAAFLLAVALSEALCALALLCMLDMSSVAV